MAAKAKTTKKTKKVPVRRKRVKVSVPIPTLSCGERAVGLTFNPSGDPTVHKLKKLYAEIIDTLDVGHWPLDKLHADMYETAILQAIDAQMWAVKAITFRG